MPLVVLPPLVHLCVPTVVLARTPAVAAKRREGAVAVPQQAGALWHLWNSVFGLFFSLSTSASTAVRSRSDGSPNPVALHWAPDAFQALAALETGAGRADAGCVIRGGAWDGDLTQAVSSCHWFIVLQGKGPSVNTGLHALSNNLTGQHHQPNSMLISFTMKI